MAPQGRCSANHATALTTTLLVFLLLHVKASQATTFMVGGSSGWTFSMNNWASGKKFKAGDTLVFKYNPSLHNVVAVDEEGYNGCTTSSSAKTYSTGNDAVKLSKGHNYFICGVPGHCDMGLKIRVDAS